MPADEDSGETLISLDESDLKYWGRIPGWNATEGAALALGLKPDDVDKGRFPDEVSREKYRKLRKLLLRAKAMRQIRLPLAPKEFLAWLRSNDLEVSAVWESSIGQVGEITNWKAKFEKERRLKRMYRSRIPKNETSLSLSKMEPKSINSLYKIILGMALAKYGWERSGKSRSAVAKEISASLPDRCGVCDQTIIKWLDAAKERLD